MFEFSWWVDIPFTTRGIGLYRRNKEPHLAFFEKGVTCERTGASEWGAGFEKFRFLLYLRYPYSSVGNERQPTNEPASQ